MSFEGYVEIGQDGVGIIETKGQAKGIFTNKVETCLVEVFVCMRAVIVIHDSMQLKLSHIERLIKKYGTITKVVFIHRPNYDGRHDVRMKKIIKMAGAAHETVSARFEVFSVACGKNGAIQILPNIMPDGVIYLPEPEKRQAVCEVNNCFLEENSQNLLLDIQYQHGEFCAPRTVDKSIDQLLETVKNQPDYFFMNLGVLGNAHENGVLELPDYLFKLYERLNLGRFRHELISSTEKTMQAHEYRAYMQYLTVEQGLSH